MNIGFLLPRSTDYPAMGYDMLAGLKAGLKQLGMSDINVCTDNIGFGEDQSATYAKAERMFLQEDIVLLIVYSNVSNAESLYPLAASLRRALIVLDAGMQLPADTINPYCYHISMQGILSCYFSGREMAQQGKKVLLATSYYDGGYRGPWSYHASIAEAGGTVCANYVSGYKTAEFSIAPYLDMLEQAGAESVAACFSSYLAELFLQSLNTAGNKAVSLPFYCSPYMAEEQLLARCDFPGGTFYATVPWASSLDYPQQQQLKAALQQQHNTINIFHVMGWEAATVARQAMEHGPDSLIGWTYDSPRGQVRIHPHTQHTYAPLYQASIIKDPNGKCALRVDAHIALNEEDHTCYLHHKPQDNAVGWRNNYLCI